MTKIKGQRWATTKSNRRLLKVYTTLFESVHEDSL